MKRGEILDAVKRTITQDRNDRHGEPENSFPRIAEEWTNYLNRRGWTLGPGALKPSDVAEMLAIFKGVRFEIQPDNPDNEHDRIGYYAIAAELRAIERSAAAGNDPYMKADKIVPVSLAVEFPPYAPKRHGEIVRHKNVDFVALNGLHSGKLMWIVDPRYVRDM